MDYLCTDRFKNMRCNIILNPKLTESIKPMNNLYLDIVNKIKSKYEICRWNDRFLKLTFRNMWLLQNEGFTNKTLINKYINSLEIYKTVTNIDGRLLRQIYSRDKEVLDLPKILIPNMIFKESTKIKNGEKIYKELDREGNQKLTLNKIYEIYFDIKRKNIDLRKNNILNHLETINSLNLEQNNKYEKMIINDVWASINKNISGIHSETIKRIRYLSLNRKQYNVKTIYINDNKFNTELIQSLNNRLQHFNTTNNNMKILGRQFIKNYKYKNRNDNASHTSVIRHEKLDDLQLSTILNGKRNNIDTTYELFLSRMNREDHFYNIKRLLKNIEVKQGRFKSIDINIPLNLMDINSLTKKIYLKNIKHLTNSQLVEDKHNKLILNAQSEDKLRIFYDRTKVIKSENIKRYKNNTMTHLKHSKKETKDSAIVETKEVRPTEKEVYSRTFLAESKENRSFSDIDINEINILADRVFKVIEKRIEIRKDRRGVR